jgi:hypothetical protein
MVEDRPQGNHKRRSENFTPIASRQISAFNGKYSEVLWAGMLTGGVGSLLAVALLS